MVQWTWCLFQVCAVLAETACLLAFHDVFEGWALEKRLTPKQTAQTIGWAESMRALAEKVGPDWTRHPNCIMASLSFPIYMITKLIPRAPITRLPLHPISQM
jgi:hypothetical protein